MKKTKKKACLAEVATKTAYQIQKETKQVGNQEIKFQVLE